MVYSRAERGAITVSPATREQAADVARLIMTAMTDDCCLYFCGEGHGLDDFHAMMTRLVERTDSQYSYQNTLVAMDGNRVAGIATAYDGSRLHALRRAFIEEARLYLHKDHSGMDDETQAGELYLDSLAVLPEYRRRGIATLLLEATAGRARRLGIPRVGLLVDEGNPGAERLYLAAGFRHADDTVWGGHPMHHLVKAVLP